MRSLGRALQLLGLTVPLLAIVAQLSNSIALMQMLAFCAASVAAFYIGRILEGYAVHRR